jgi:hypothetical protein
MCRRPTRVLVAVLFCLAVASLAPVAAFAQEGEAVEVEAMIPRYGPGDYVLSLRLGLNLPLFWLSTQPIGLPAAAGERTQASPHDPNLNLMYMAALSWSTYLSENWTIGAELAGTFGVDINNNTLFMVPILARGGYVFNLPEFEIPVTFGLGGLVMRLSDRTSFAFVALPGVSVLWRATSNWSFGATAEYWFAWEPPWEQPADGPELPHMFGNFVSLTATAVYHF